MRTSHDEMMIPSVLDQHIELEIGEEWENRGYDVLLRHILIPSQPVCALKP